MMRDLNFIKILINVVPSFLLPNVSKSVNGEVISLDLKERREFLERAVNHKVGQALNKYSPIKRLNKFYKKILLRKKQMKFYCLIGQITLMHAGIEQELKNTLIVDLDLGTFLKIKQNNQLPKITEKSHGNKLNKDFIILLKEMYIPKLFLDRYELLCAELLKHSERRNYFLKACYSFNQDTTDVHKVHAQKHGKYDLSRTYEEMIEAWIPKVNLIELSKLLEDLSILRERFINTKAEIFSDKLRQFVESCSEYGKSYPEYASKNPYWYCSTK